MDRNLADAEYLQRTNVALRKESVDRNGRGVCKTIHPLVALRKESVDRNAQN